MATLVSPGVNVSVISEDFFVSSGPGTVPLIFIATKQDKVAADGVTLAEGTTKENAGKLNLITSQGELINTFGTPDFNFIQGTAQHGYELNEYGLLAAHSYLGIANRAYVVRGDIDLAELEPQDEAPDGSPFSGTFWMDLANSKIGLFEWNDSESQWEKRSVKIVEDSKYITSTGKPSSSFPAKIGDFAIVAGRTDVPTENQIFRREANAWQLIDNSEVSENIQFSPHTKVPSTRTGTAAANANIVDGGITNISIQDGGSGYSIGDSASITTSTGSGFAATVSDITDGIVDTVTISTGGQDYALGENVTAFSSSGTGFTGEVTSLTNGIVNTISIQDGGSGYSVSDSASITSANGSSFAGEVGAIDDGVPTTLSISDGGRDYLIGDNVAAAGGASGTGFSGTVDAIKNNIVESLTINDGGQDYSNGDAVGVVGGIGTGFTGAVDGTEDGKVDTFNISNGGTNYAIGDSVTSSGSGSGFSGEVSSIGGSGEVTGIQINDGGSGYSAGESISITSSTGSGFSGTIASVRDGVVTSINVTSGGEGYAVGADLSITSGTGTGFDGEVASVFDGQVESITIDTPGKDYTVSDGIEVQSSTGFGSGFTGTISATNDGVVTSITVNDGGTDYDVGDDVTLTGAGSGFSGKISDTIDGVIDGITVITGGQNYTSGDSLGVDTINGTGFSGTINAVTDGVIAGFDITDPGETYTVSDTVSVSGGGSGFSGDVVIKNGVIRSLTITNNGSGYSNNPDVRIHGDGSGATATSTITGDQVNSLTMQTFGSGYSSANVVIDGPALQDGDLWIKTTSPNLGTDIAVNLYDNNSQQFIEQDAPLESSRDKALLLYNNDPVPGDLFVHYDYVNSNEAGFANDWKGSKDNVTFEMAIMRHNGDSEVVATGSVEDVDINNGGTLSINGTSITLAQDETASDVVSKIIAANIDDIEAEVGANNNVVVKNTAGQDIEFLNQSGNMTLELGFTDGIAKTNGYIYSNWEHLAYEALSEQPTRSPQEGRLWYSTEFKVDLLVNNGEGGWEEFDKELFLQPSKPEIGQLSTGDIWIDTDQIDDYPVIKKWNGVTFVDVDNTDQTSPNGIIFRDARPTNGGSLDADTPDPLLYPGGMLLWNTRYSTLNVKEWKPDYTFEGTVIGDRWVTKSGNRVDGSPFMGRHAVKQIITQAVADSIAGNTDIRAESVFFNLMAAPGFPELIDEMVSLNVDRGQTAFIIGDTPFRLEANGTKLEEWATNKNDAPSNGEDGLLTSDTYLGLYYPSGFTTNTDGREVAVPASHIALRTYGFNDQVAYQWFAPAGYQRGVVTNATSVGYIDQEDEFVPVELNQGLRDVLYTNNINPIAFRPNKGLVVFGQKSRHPLTSALDRVNVGRLINYIRYQSPQLAEPFLFQPNDEITRAQVQEVFERFLDELITLRGLQDYRVIVDETNNTPTRIDRNELWVDLVIIPTKAIEFIYIPVRIRETGSNLSLEDV